MRELVLIREGEFPELELPWEKKALASMSGLHVNRRREWVNGRVALTLAFERFGIRLTPEEEFSGYQRLVKFPDFSFSLSHTEGFAGALLIDQRASLGLDLEKKDRVVDPRIRERFSHPEDAPLSPILLWAAKEAAYKSLPADVQSKLWLQSIRIGESDFSGTGFHGHWEQVAHPELVVVTATCLA